MIFFMLSSYAVCREICLERGEYGQMFKYYLIDNSKKHQIFSLINSKPECFEQLCCDNVKVTFIIFSWHFVVICLIVTNSGKFKNYETIIKSYIKLII